MNKIFAGCLLLVLGALSAPAHAESLVGVNGSQYLLDRASPGAMRITELGTKVMKRRMYSLMCKWTYAAQGGASGTSLSLLDKNGKACVLPSGAIIRDVLFDFSTAATSGGSATLSVGTAQNGAGFKSALAVASATGLVAGIPVGTAATAIKLTADRTPTLTVSAATLTAGVMNAYIQFQLPE